MNGKYELILCIVNTGFSDTVMDAAKEKGARGGTVIHARGTANKEAEEFFHITIQPDKEIVMILVPAEIRDDVLHALYQSAGLKTDGQGIAFALPVNNVVGLSQAANGDKKRRADKSDEAAATNTETSISTASETNEADGAETREDETPPTTDDAR